MTAPISKDELVRIIYRDVFEAAVTDAEAFLANPPGRNPANSALELRDWYSRLSEQDKSQLRVALRKAADFAVFGMLSILDNVRPITDGFSQELRLSVETDGELFDLSEGEHLHDIFRNVVATEQES